MNIKFIGTGSGKTSLDRYHSSFLITSSDHKLLVDCGDGTARALIAQNVHVNSINSIIISHLHPDHYSGLPSLLTQMKLEKRREKLALYIHKSEKGFIEKFIQHSYLFLDRLSFELEIIPFSEEEKISITEQFSFVSKCNTHLEKYRGNKSSEKLSFVSLSFLIKDQENSLIFTGDVGSKEDLFLFDEKVDWFITEITHSSPTGLMRLLNEDRAKIIIVTHLDPVSEEMIQQFQSNSYINEINSMVIIATDGFELYHYQSGCL